MTGSLTDLYARVANSEGEALRDIQKLGDEFLAELESKAAMVLAAKHPSTVARAFTHRLHTTLRTLFAQELPTIIRQYEEQSDNSDSQKE